MTDSERDVAKRRERLAAARDDVLAARSAVWDATSAAYADAYAAYADVDHALAALALDTAYVDACDTYCAAWDRFNAIKAEVKDD